MKDPKRSLEDLADALADMDMIISAQRASNENMNGRLIDAERRATLYERRANDYQAKAKRTEDLEEACEKLLVAMDRLPTKMEDAGIISTSAPSEIPLYGTYDWQAVMDAKLALALTMKRGET